MTDNRNSNPEAFSDEREDEQRTMRELNEESEAECA